MEVNERSQTVTDQVRCCDGGKRKITDSDRLGELF